MSENERVMELSRLAETSRAVSSTRSRSAKIALLADLIRDLDPPEVEPGIGLIVGSPRQGKIGVGWATVASVAFEPAERSSLTVGDVDTLFEDLARAVGPGSTGRRKELLSTTLCRATDGELEFLRSVLVGELRQGALAGVVSDAVAVAAGVPKDLVRRAVMLRGDLGSAALTALIDGAAGLEAVRLRVGRAIDPMLASTAADPAEALLSTGTSLVEWKLDGARIQVHRDDDDVWVFTRNLNDVANRLPHVVSVVRAMPARQLVLDGEVMGFNDAGAPHAFQDTMSTFGTEMDRPDNMVLRPFFFDAMLINDQDLLDEPLSIRRAAMLDVVGPHSIPAIETSDPIVAQQHLDAAIAAGHEGVMIKSLHGAYEAGRRGKSWQKIKPVYTLDLVVLAAEWGHGRRQGWLSNLHLGARNADPDGPPFLMVGKTFKGLTDDLLEWQTAAFLEREISRSSSGHTVHVNPDLVVEIAVDGVQKSTRYPGGVALRFARVRGYRPDRAPESADSIDNVRLLLPGARFG